MKYSMPSITETCTYVNINHIQTKSLLKQNAKKRLIPYAKTEQNKQTLQHKTYV